MTHQAVIPSGVGDPSGSVAVAKVRILIADDHAIIRDGLRSLLEAEPDFQIVGEAGDGAAVVEQARKVRPDIVIMDLTMPDLNGVDATRQILSDLPATRVIAMSMHGDRRHVTEMLKAGASGYLLKGAPYEELARAIRLVRDSQAYLSPQIANDVIDQYVHPQGANGNSSVFSKLTPREREVLQLLAEGHDPKQVGLRLHISVKTVQTHRQHIMEKLELHNLADLTKYAIREGLTSLEI